MELSFIAVNKVIKNRNGELVAEPEMIKLKEIKSFRIWHKNPAEKIAFREDLTIIYMRDVNEDGKTEVKAIKILEPCDVFSDRIGTVKFGFKGEVKVK
jgi:hypothetical protein